MFRSTLKRAWANTHVDVLHPGRSIVIRMLATGGRGLACMCLSCVAAALPLTAQESDGRARPLEILPVEEETALALSAAPDHLRPGAGVVALTSNGFELVRASANGYTCIVNRDHPQSRKPTCYDAEGTATVLPTVKFVGELLLNGTPMAEIARRVQSKFDRGEFIAPRRPGVAYMLSEQIRRYVPERGETRSFPPHVMFYAPELTNDDIGTSLDALSENPWLPFVAYEGPHGFLVMVPDFETRGESDSVTLLAMHEAVLRAHRESNVDAWLDIEGEDYVVANRGSVTFPTLEERLATRRPYLERVHFDRYEDIIDPIVAVSADGTMGWVIAEIAASGVEIRPDGSNRPVEFSAAWIELYRKIDGEWKLTGNVSNLKGDGTKAGE